MKKKFYNDKKKLRSPNMQINSVGGYFIEDYNINSLLTGLYAVL